MSLVILFVTVLLGILSAVYTADILLAQSVEEFKECFSPDGTFLGKDGACGVYLFAALSPKEIESFSSNFPQVAHVQLVGKILHAVFIDTRKLQRRLADSEQDDEEDFGFMPLFSKRTGNLQAELQSGVAPFYDKSSFVRPYTINDYFNLEESQKNNRFFDIEAKLLTHFMRCSHGLCFEFHNDMEIKSRIITTAAAFVLGEILNGSSGNPFIHLNWTYLMTFGCDYYIVSDDFRQQIYRMLHSNPNETIPMEQLEKEKVEKQWEAGKNALDGLIGDDCTGGNSELNQEQLSKLFNECEDAHLLAYLLSFPAPFLVYCPEFEADLKRPLSEIIDSITSEFVQFKSDLNSEISSGIPDQRKTKKLFVNFNRELLRAREIITNKSTDFKSEMSKDDEGLVGKIEKFFYPMAEYLSYFNFFTTEQVNPETNEKELIEKTVLRPLSLHYTLLCRTMNEFHLKIVYPIESLRKEQRLEREMNQLRLK